ncbi:MerR family transcriptional regulator [Jatrophihabitans fulvus]
MSVRANGMLTVSEVARRAGLTARALRHYDQLGLLVPEAVSDDGYRWYGEAQVDNAVMIARLRSLDVPLGAIRAILAGADGAEVRRILAQQRAALQARDDGIRRALHSLDHLLDDERGLPMALQADVAVPADDERQLAIALFNDTWTLLEQERRSPEEDDRLIHLAHASRLHWDNVGDDQNRLIGEWQIARVYCALGRSETAVFHARRSVDYAGRAGIDTWAVASAHEGLARALAVADDMDAARDARDRALSILADVPDPEDRKIVSADIDTLPIP